MTCYVQSERSRWNRTPTFVPLRPGRPTRGLDAQAWTLRRATRVRHQAEVRGNQTPSLGSRPRRKSRCGRRRGSHLGLRPRERPPCRWSGARKLVTGRPTVVDEVVAQCGQVSPVKALLHRARKRELSWLYKSQPLEVLD